MTVNPKEELVKSLGEIHVAHNGKNLSYTMKRWELELVADWIIEDRKRIVLPCVQINILAKSYGGYYKLHYPALECVVTETLNLAGIELERN